MQKDFVLNKAHMMINDLGLCVQSSDLVIAKHLHVKTSWNRLKYAKSMDLEIFGIKLKYIDYTWEVCCVFFTQNVLDCKNCICIKSVSLIWFIFFGKARWPCWILCPWPVWPQYPFFHFHGQRSCYKMTNVNNTTVFQVSPSPTFSDPT